MLRNFRNFEFEENFTTFILLLLLLVVVVVDLNLEGIT